MSSKNETRGSSPYLTVSGLPNVRWGASNAFKIRGDNNRVDNFSPIGEVEYEFLNRRKFSDKVHLNEFYGIIRDFAMARLGFPVIRVELTDFQVLTAIDEAIAKLDYHAPDWTVQHMTFDTSAGVNLYELPSFVLNNFRYAAYKKTLLSVPTAAGTLEQDFFIKYFQDNFLMSDFAAGDFMLLKMHLKQLRKILGREGSFQVLDGRYLALFPSPTHNDTETVVVEYKCLNSNTLHPYFMSWIQRYTTAICKGILGQVRGKYESLPSPGGGTRLNGPALTEQSSSEMEILIAELLGEIEEPPVFTVY
jgi:hypothetical protein